MLTRTECFLSICALVSFRICNSESVSSQDLVTEKVLTSSNAQEASDGLMTEERFIRALGSRKAHLRKHDANQVAQYFISGGPLVGRSHFQSAQDSGIDPDDQYNPLGMPNIPYPNYGHPIHSARVPHIPSLHPTYPYGHSHSLNYPYSSPYYPPYNPYGNSGSNYLPSPPFHNWQTPHSNSLLGSPIDQQPQSMGNGFYSTPSSILRIPVLNAQDYSNSYPILNQKNDNQNSMDSENPPNVGAPQPNSQPDEVQPLQSSKPIFEAIIPHIPNKMYSFPQSYYNPTPSEMYQPPPAGYILRLIPHSPNVSPDTVSNTNAGAPTVGAPKAQPAESSSNNEVYHDAQDGTDEDNSDSNNC